MDDEISFQTRIDRITTILANHPSRGQGMGAVNDTVWALVFTDVVGSTNLLIDVGDEAYATIITAHIDRARLLIAEKRGEEVDTAGDGIFCIFYDVISAFEYAR